MGVREAGAIEADPQPRPKLAWPEVPRQLSRPQPIRDALLAYLETPRFVCDIARHIERPVPTTTGHLAAMRRLGLVKRLGHATYALAGYEGPVPMWKSPRPGLPWAVRAKVRTALRQPASLREVVQRTGLPEADVRLAIQRLWMAGCVAGDEISGYRPMRSLLKTRK